MSDTPATHLAQLVPLDLLKPHPRNYNGHPEDQVQQLAAAIRQHGFYKNVVTASDWTILAGHGAVKAAAVAGLESIPVVRLDLDKDSTQALKIVAGDNELARFAERDDRQLTDLLREISEEDPLGLVGTGYDEQVLAALTMVTRTTGEIEDFDAAAEWAGMPDYEPETRELKLIVTFASLEDRNRFIEEHQFRPFITYGVKATDRQVLSAAWPLRERAMQDTTRRWETAEDPA